MICFSKLQSGILKRDVDEEVCDCVDRVSDVRISLGKREGLE